MKKPWSDEPKQKIGVQLKKEHETKRRVCADCNIEKAWIYKKSSGMRKLYVDDNGKMWNSTICRDCHNKKYNTAYQKKIAFTRKTRKKLREKAKAAFNPRMDLDIE